MKSLSMFFPQAGGFPEPEIIHYNPKEFDFGKKKAFPFRDQVDKIHKSKSSSTWNYQETLIYKFIFFRQTQFGI